jgi:hypothetical protein
MASAEARRQLGALQSDLMRALHGQGAALAGADTKRLSATAEGLFRKRRRSVARAWPALVQALGNQFSERFAAFAAETALPREGGALADGREFVRFLAKRGDLPDAGRLEALAVDLRYSQSACGLVPRRGPAFKMSVLKNPRRLILALRLPWLGQRWLTVPLSFLGNRDGNTRPIQVWYNNDHCT